ncbi:MAG: hypothetical protein IKQ39_00540 [Oscillospiraceae bacterium]|nr:hypothetical protein [Oscillospiraceae bacterium]
MPAAHQSPANERILAMAMVLLTQAQDNDENDSKLWDYLLTQLGYDDAAAKKCSKQTLRNKVTEILDHVFQYEGKFYSEDGHRYFNTLRLHALAPTQSVEHLYNLLYDFYKTNLECQYTEGDNSYRIFVRQICKRWQNKSADDQTESDMKTRSDYLAASFRELFTQRPEYTAALCDALVYRMDVMLRGSTDIFAEENRWDQLMLGWYRRKAETERQRMKQSSAQARISRIVTDSAKIAPAYHYKDEQLSLFLPRIRLPEITERPTAVLLQGGRVIDSMQLSVFGNDLCLTTREIQIILSGRAHIDWDSPMDFRILLQCGGRLLYDSGQQLYRSYLLFRVDGEETRRIPQVSAAMYLVYGWNSEMMYDETEDVNYTYGSDFQVFEFIPSSLRLLSVNGKNLLQKKGQGMQCMIYGDRVPDASVTGFGETALLFRSSPYLYVSADSAEQMKQYVCDINGTALPLYQAANAKTDARIPLPAAQNQIGRVAVRSFYDGRIIFEQLYSVLPDFTHRFEPAYYYSGQLFGKVHISAMNRQNTISFELSRDQHSVTVPLTPDIGLTLSAPWIQAELNGEDAFSLPAYIWKDFFQQHPFLQITAPKWLEIHLMLGGTELPRQQNGYDIRSAVRALCSNAAGTPKTCPLGILLKKSGAAKPDQILLSNLALHPFLTESPVICRDRTIYWEPSGKYIGPACDTIRVLLENDEGTEPWVYVCDPKKSFIIEKAFPCKEGSYRYEIRAEQANALQAQAEQTLLQGEIIIRDPEELRYEGAVIYLTAAKFETNSWLSSWEAKIPFGCARLVDIQYETISVPLEGKLKDYQDPVPCFSAFLQFRIARVQKWNDFNSDPDNTEYTLINPVLFWQVTSESGLDYLILQGRDGRRIMMEEFRSGCVSVVNRSSAQIPGRRRKRADRFEFQVEADADVE